MTAADQHHRWGICAEAQGDDVLIQMGDRMVFLSPAEARKFAFEICGAYYRAGRSEEAVRAA